MSSWAKQQQDWLETSQPFCVAFLLSQINTENYSAFVTCFQMAMEGAVETRDTFFKPLRHCHFFFLQMLFSLLFFLTKTPLSAFKASLGLCLGLLGTFWAGDSTETNVSMLAVPSLGETSSMVRLMIPEGWLFCSKHSGSGHCLH